MGQLGGNRAADQSLCFCYIDSTSNIPLLSKSEILSLLPFNFLRLYSQACIGPGRKPPKQSFLTKWLNKDNFEYFFAKTLVLCAHSIAHIF